MYVCYKSLLLLLLSCLVLFICGLLNDAISTSDYVISNTRMINDDGLEKIQKGMAVASSKVLSQYSPEGTEENH